MGLFETIAVIIITIIFGVFALTLIFTLVIYSITGSGIRHGDSFDHDAEIRRLEINLGNERDFRKRSEIEGMIARTKEAKHGRGL